MAYPRRDNHLQISEPEGSLALTTMASVTGLEEPATISESLWLQPESMIVFQTENLLYRLPHSPFSKKSFVFRRFLESPNLISADFERGLHVDSTPLIKLLDVSSEEGETFLKALYDSEFFEPPPSLTSVKIVLSILKLSTRYEVQFLRRRALAHLSLAYPTHLEQWDYRVENSTFPIEGDYGNFVSSTLPNILMVIHTAEKYDAPWILPSALYECCRYNLQGLLNNPMWKDGTIDDDLKTTILVGFMNQIATTPKALAFLLQRSLNGHGCGQSEACLEIRRAVQEKSLNWSMQNPLGIWDEDDWSNDELEINQMCDTCLAVCKRVHRETRNNIWEALPGIFDLPDWDVLMALQAAVMER